MRRHAWRCGSRLGETATLPEEPNVPTPWSMVTEVVFWLVQVSVVLWPVAIVCGLARSISGMEREGRDGRLKINRASAVHCELDAVEAFVGAV